MCKSKFASFRRTGSYHYQHKTPFVHAIQPQTGEGNKKKPLYNLFAAYIHRIPLEELIDSVERAKLDAKQMYVVIYGAACSYSLARAERLDGSYLRTFALELREQLAQTLATFVISILTGPHSADGEDAAAPPLRQIIDVLQQVMCTRDAEKLAISVLEIYGDGHREESTRIHTTKVPRKQRYPS